MSDTQLTQNTKNENPPEKRKRGVAGRVGSFLINVLMEGLGAALGIAIVAFVAFTVMGVYNLQQRIPKMEETLQTLTESVQQMEKRHIEMEQHRAEAREQWEERSRKLREEIIKSGQLAVELMLKEIQTEKDDEEEASPLPVTPPLLPEAERPRIKAVPPVQQMEMDALKYRFREEQQRVQEKW